MSETTDAVVWTLSEDECWNLLARCELGRLAVVIDGRPDIFPVNHVVDGPRVLFRTALGSKLDDIAANPEVAFEADLHDDELAASVVVRGVARRLERQRDIDAADALALTPWIPTLKYHWVQISPHTISGRRFARAAEPVRYAASADDDRT